MKIIHIAFFAVLALSLIGCSSGSSGAAPSSGGGGGGDGGGDPNIVMSGGVEFNITTSIAGVPDAWKTGDVTLYNGYGIHAISILSISKDDSYDGGFYSVNGIPCILETLIITTISASVSTQNYLAEGTDGVLYNLRIDDDVLEIAHIVFPDDGLGATWENVELDGSTTSYEITGLGEETNTYTPNSDVFSVVTILQYNSAVSGAHYTYYDTDLIPIEIGFYAVGLPTGYFVAQWADVPTIIAPAGEG